MCPLRIILIFLSATLAGFFVLRNLKSQPQINDEDDEASVTTIIAPTTIPQISDSSKSPAFKVRAALESGFWTFVDMASGRYLWRHMVSASSAKRSS